MCVSGSAFAIDDCSRNRAAQGKEEGAVVISRPIEPWFFICNVTFCSGVSVSTSLM